MAPPAHASHNQLILGSGQQIFAAPAALGAFGRDHVRLAVRELTHIALFGQP